MAFAANVRALQWWQPRVILSAILLVVVSCICAAADSGSDLYKAKCSACHGKTGAADTMLGKNLKLRSLSSTDIQNQTDDELFAIISKGKNRMPAFGTKLTKDQIRELVRHIRTLKK